MTLKDELIGYGNATMDSAGLTQPKGRAVVLKRVFMPAGTYPPQRELL